MKNSLKEMEEKTIKKLEEINKSLKESQEKAVNQVKEMVQDLKTEIEAIKPRKIWKQKIWVNDQELQMQA